jgi:lambda family phage tail tape measure protein
MADINVTMALDDSQLTSKLAAATKNAESFGAKAKAAMNSASDGTDKLTHGVESLNHKLEGLVGLLVGVGLTEFIKSSLEAASATAEMAHALGVSTASMIEMQLAASVSGKNADDLGKMMNKMEIAAQGAVDGNGNLKQSFLTLGVTTNDFRSKSPDEIFRQIGKALQAIEDPAKRASLSMDIFSKAGRGMDWKDYNDKLDQVAGTQDKAAVAAEAAKKMMDEMAIKAQAVRFEFLQLIQPMLDFIGDNSNGLNGAKYAAQGLLVVMAGFTAGAIATGLRSLIGVVSGVAAAFVGQAAAVGVAAAATVGLTAADMALLRVEAAAATARAAALTVIVAENTAKIASLATTELDIVATATLTAAKRALWLATGQLALANGTAAGATAALAAAEGVATVGAVGATAAVGGLAVAEGVATVATGGLLAGVISLSIALAPYVLGVLALAAAYKVMTDESLRSKIGMAGMMDDASFANGTANFDDMSAAAKKLGSEANKTDETMKRLGITVNSASGGGRGTTPVTRPSSPMMGKENVDLDPNAAAVQGLKNQAAQLQLVNALTLARLDIEINLVNASEASRKSILAEFDAGAAAGKEMLRIQGEIKRLQVEQANSTDKSKNQSQIAELQKQSAAYSAQAAAIGERNKKLVEAQNLNAMETFMTEQKLKVTENLKSITTEMDQMTMTNDEKKIDNINKQIQGEVALAIAKRQSQLGTGEVVSETEAAAIKERITGIYEVQKIATADSIAKSREWNTGWNSAFKQYVEDGTNAAKMANDAFNSMTSNMNSAIDNFVTTGKFSFEDFAKSVIQDLIKIELKAQAVQAMKAIGGGVGGFIGSLFGFAEGGDPPVGKASIVGEKGPELFVPKQAGTIIPNNKLGGAVLGAQAAPVVHNTYITNNVSAIDAKSVAQLFAENRKTLLGTVRMAEKEMPYSSR